MTRTLLVPFMLVLAGICIFLIGLDIAKKTFKEAAGKGISRFMYNISHNRFLSFVFGIGLSAISQSSTAASSFSVGLVDLGMLPLESAIVVNIGASIGTAFVTFVISLDLIVWAPLILAVSTVTARVGRGRIAGIARTAEGLSLLMTGMLILETGVAPLISDGLLRDVVEAAAGNPLYVGAVSFLLVSLIQSSPAVMAMAIALASAGVLPLPSIVAVVLGSHMGAATIVLLSAAGARVNARRLAWSNFIYRLAGVMLFTPLSGYVTGITSSMTSSLPVQVGLVHLSVTGLNVILGLPLCSLLAELVQRLVLPSEREAAGEPAFLSAEMQEFPLMAMNLLVKEMTRLGNYCEEMFALLADIGRNGDRMTYLRDGTKRLLSSCIDFFSGIRPPGPQDYWKDEYGCISYSLAALGDLARAIGDGLYPLAEEGDCRPFYENKEDWSAELVRILSRLMAQSVGAFALGGKEMSIAAVRTWEKYLELDKSIRYGLFGQGSKTRSAGAGDLRIWECLAVSNRIARASYELARGSSAEYGEEKE